MISMLDRLVLGCAITAILSSCTAHRLYRPPDTDLAGRLASTLGPFFDSRDQRLGQNNVLWGVAVLEFDDQGELWDEAQLRDLEIHQVMGALNGGGMIAVIYVHGWKHDASKQDERFGNLHDFEEFVRRTAADEPADRGRFVLGVYMAWRGDSLELPEPLRNASYYDRNAAAERVAGAATTEVLYRLMRTTFLPDSRVIVIGHSMGAKIVERALIPAYEAQLLDPRPLLNAAVSEEPQPWRPAADLVILINPASPAIEAKKFIDMLNRHRVHDETASSQALYVCTPAANGWRPLIVSVTSEADLANKLFFPIGNALSNALTRTREYTHWRLKYRQDIGLARTCCGDESRTITDEYLGPTMTLPKQRFFLLHTAGFARVLHTHRVVHEKGGGDAGTCVPDVCRSVADVTILKEPGLLAGKACFTDGENRYILQELPDRYNTTPYWIMQVPKSIMRSHTDVFNETMSGFIRGIVRLSGALDRDAVSSEAPPE